MSASKRCYRTAPEPITFFATGTGARWPSWRLKKAEINPAEAEARAYAEQLQAPYIFHANGDLIRTKDTIRDCFLVPHQIYKARAVTTAADGGSGVMRDELYWSAMEPITRTELGKIFGIETSIVIDPGAPVPAEEDAER